MNRLVARMLVVLMFCIIGLTCSSQAYAEEMFTRQMLYRMVMNKEGTKQTLFKLNVYASVPDILTLRKKQEYRMEAGMLLDNIIGRFRQDGWVIERPLSLDTFDLVDLSIELEIKEDFKGKDVWLYNYVSEPDRLMAQKKFRGHPKSWDKFLNGFVAKAPNEDWDKFIGDCVKETRESLIRKYNL